MKNRQKGEGRAENCAKPECPNLQKMPKTHAKEEKSHASGKKPKM
ncbi:hypothetical protein [Flavobacterium tistrianum]|nr:hypothetical protein [Flavobacterium tistrianum]